MNKLCSGPLLEKYDEELFLEYRTNVENFIAKLTSIHNKAISTPLYIEGNSETLIRYWEQMLEASEELSKTLKDGIHFNKSALEMWRTGPFD